MREKVGRHAPSVILMAILLVPILVLAILLWPNQLAEDPLAPTEFVHYPGNDVQADTGMSEKLSYYLDRNADVVGLLSIDGTLLEAPVVCSDGDPKPGHSKNHWRGKP